MKKNLIVRTADFAMHLLSQYIEAGDCVIDATAGNGNDTLALARLTDASHAAGKVYSFDIQQTAITNTYALLTNNGFPCRVLAKFQAPDDQTKHNSAKINGTGQPDSPFANGTDRLTGAFVNETDRPYAFANGVILIQDSHDTIKDYVREPIAGAIFNLGYLPGQDKSIITQAASTLSAISQAAALLKRGAALAAVMYPGHEGGQSEKDLLLQYAQHLDAKLFHAAHIHMINQPDTAPGILLLTRK